MKAEKLDALDAWFAQNEGQNPVSALYDCLLPKILDMLRVTPDWQALMHRRDLLSNAQHILGVHVEAALRQIILHTEEAEGASGLPRDVAFQEVEQDVAQIISLLCMLVAHHRNR